MSDLLPCKVGSAGCIFEVSDERNVVVDFIVLRSDHQKRDAKQKFLLFNLIAMTLDKKPVKVDYRQLLSDVSLLEAKSYVENPLN